MLGNGTLFWLTRCADTLARWQSVFCVICGLRNSTRGRTFWKHFVFSITQVNTKKLLCMFIIKYSILFNKLIYCLVFEKAQKIQSLWKVLTLLGSFWKSNKTDLMKCFNIKVETDPSKVIDMNSTYKIEHTCYNTSKTILNWCNLGSLESASMDLPLSAFYIWELYFPPLLFKTVQVVIAQPDRVLKTLLI